MVEVREQLADLKRAWAERVPVLATEPAPPLSTRAWFEEMRDRLIADRDDPDMQSSLGDILRYLDRVEWILARLPEDA